MNQNNPIFVTPEQELFLLEISKKDLDLIYKFLSRSDIKGFEIAEFNKVLDILNPAKLKSKV
jgi:sulfite reductase beta subunit-like hemoprotein